MKNHCHILIYYIFTFLKKQEMKTYKAILKDIDLSATDQEKRLYEKLEFSIPTYIAMRLKL